MGDATGARSEPLAKIGAVLPAHILQVLQPLNFPVLGVRRKILMTRLDSIHKRCTFNRVAIGTTKRALYSPRPGRPPLQG